MRARLIESLEIAPEVRHFVFELPEVERLAFQPGQFVSFSAEVGGKQITRAYSISSAPDGNRFDLCLNRVQDGLLSPVLFEYRSGDEIECKGPYGAFVLREPPSDSIFVAAGTGVAPMRSMLHHQLPRDSEHQYTLIFGVRYERTLLYRDEFERLAAEFGNFDFRPVLSRPDANWTGRTGHAQPHLMQALGERRDVDVYICGLKCLVNDTRTLLKEAGLDRRRIVHERYD